MKGHFPIASICILFVLLFYLYLYLYLFRILDGARQMCLLVSKEVAPIWWETCFCTIDFSSSTSLLFRSRAKTRPSINNLYNREQDFCATFCFAARNDNYFRKSGVVFNKKLLWLKIIFAQCSAHLTFYYYIRKEKYLLLLVMTLADCPIAGDVDFAESS